MPVGPAGIGRQHEVVRIRHVVRDQAETVDPGIPDAAAGEEPAIPRGRVVDGERCAVPGVGLGLLVELGADDARLAVTNGAQDNVVDLRSTRNPQPHGRAPAQLVGAVEHVGVGAIVVWVSPT